MDWLYWGKLALQVFGAVTILTLTIGVISALIVGADDDDHDIEDEDDEPWNGGL